MNRFIALCGALALSACASFNPLASVNNPISGTNLYEGELLFDGSVKTFNELKTLCANRVLPPACRTYVVKGQGLIRQAYAADKAARTFIVNNPKLDATNVVQAFTGLVSDFKSNLDALSATK